MMRAKPKRSAIPGFRLRLRTENSTALCKETRFAWESAPNGDLTMEALDAELICETARMGVAYGRLDAMADVTDPQRLLRKFGLMKNGRIFNGAAVLFGKDFVDYPQ